MYGYARVSPDGHPADARVCQTRVADPTTAQACKRAPRLVPIPREHTVALVRRDSGRPKRPTSMAVLRG